MSTLDAIYDRRRQMAKPYVADLRREGLAAEAWLLLMPEVKQVSQLHGRTVEVPLWDWGSGGAFVERVDLMALHAREARVYPAYSRAAHTIIVPDMGDDAPKTTLAFGILMAAGLADCPEAVPYYQVEQELIPLRKRLLEQQQEYAALRRENERLGQKLRDVQWQNGRLTARVLQLKSGLCRALGVLRRRAA